MFTFDSTETVPYAANTLFRHLRKHFGGPAALAFLYQTYVKLEEERQTEPDAALTLTMLRLAYQQVMEGNAAHPEYNEAAKLSISPVYVLLCVVCTHDNGRGVRMDFDHLLRSGTYTRAIVRSNEYASDRGLLGSSAVVLVNGLHLDSRSVRPTPPFRHSLGDTENRAPQPESLVFTSVVPSETRVLIQKLLEGSVGDKTDIYALLTKNASKVWQTLAGTVPMSFTEYCSQPEIVAARGLGRRIPADPAYRRHQPIAVCRHALALPSRQLGFHQSQRRQDQGATAHSGRARSVHCRWSHNAGRRLRVSGALPRGGPLKL